MEPTLDIDQDLAKRLLVEGATFIFLGVPPGTDFGIDLKSWTTGDQFKGVKMIPPGVHLIHFSATNKHGDSSPRVSFMYDFKKSERVIRKWDLKTEEMSSAAINEEEGERIKSNLLELDKHLGPYPFDIWNDWKKISCHINGEHLQRLMPEHGVIRSALELQATEKPPDEPNRRAKTQNEKEEDLLPHLVPVPGSDLRLTPLPRHSYPEGSTPAQITRHSLDPTYSLESMFTSLASPMDLLSEVEFSFVCFFCGMSLEAFEHWKDLVSLICKCETALCKYREFYYHFLTILEIQLFRIPEMFLVDIVSSENLVYVSLRTLFRNMGDMDQDVEGRLRALALRFKAKLTDKFLWDFEDLNVEEGEDAPVVVELEN